MANIIHLAILRKGIGPWNLWRKEHPDVTPDLTDAPLSRIQLNAKRFSKKRLAWAHRIQKTLNGYDKWEFDSVNADLSGVDLRGADLSWADLSDCNINNADLSGAVLIGCDLTGASLTESNLSRAIMDEAVIKNTNLVNSSLRGASLRRALIEASNLKGSEFKEAVFGDTVLADVDLSAVQSVNDIRHVSASTIGIDTIINSKALLYKQFMRGCGIPEIFIEYIPSMVNTPIQYQSCFISYSSSDQTFAEKLYQDLSANGVRCWYAPEDLKIGDRIRTALDNAIHLHEKLVLVLSSSSVNSQWVEQEVESAMELERQQNKIILFPIRIDDSVMNTSSGWAAHIKRTRQIGNFTDHCNYRASLDRFLRDLRISPS